MRVINFIGLGRYFSGYQLSYDLNDMKITQISLVITQSILYQCLKYTCVQIITGYTEHWNILSAELELAENVQNWNLLKINHLFTKKYYLFQQFVVFPELSSNSMFCLIRKGDGKSNFCSSRTNCFLQESFLVGTQVLQCNPEWVHDVPPKFSSPEVKYIHCMQKRPKALPQ